LVSARRPTGRERIKDVGARYFLSTEGKSGPERSLPVRQRKEIQEVLRRRLMLHKSS
jgi:hypothetical protein